MRDVISQFVIFFLLTLLLWIGLTCICQNMRYCNAREYYEKILQQIEDSYFEPTVIRDCTIKAKEQGYQLSVQCYGESQKDARVILRYEYTLPMVQVKRQCVIDGYAR